MDKERIEKRYQEILGDAENSGYTLNPDKEFCLTLVEGLLTNDDRYTIEACPCRLYEGEVEDNYDIICPCDYRDDDLADYGACFCALYINDQYDSERQVPERRPSLDKRKAEKTKREKREGESQLKEEKARGYSVENFQEGLSYPVWRCSVCGYLCANNHPPGKCPICKVGKERFKRFI